MASNLSIASLVPFDSEMSEAETSMIKIPYFPNEIWWKVAQVIEADWKDKDRSVSFRNEAFGALKSLSLVNHACRYYAQSALFRQVWFCGCFGGRNFDKFAVVTQTKISRHVQEMFMSASIMCTQAEGKHLPFVTFHNGSSGTDPANSDTEIQIEMNAYLQKHHEENAMYKAKLIMYMSHRSLKRFSLFSRDQHSEELDPKARSRLASLSFEVAVDSLRTLDFRNLMSLSLVSPDDPKALWELCHNPSGSTVLLKNLLRLKEFSLYFKHDFAQVGKFLACLKPAMRLDTLELQLGYCDYRPYCPIRVPGIEFHMKDAKGMENVTVLGLERLVVVGCLSEVIGTLSRLQRLELVEVQLDEDEDDWSKVLDVCTKVTLLPWLYEILLRRVGYKCRSLARCGVWNTTPRSPPAGEKHARALCTSIASDGFGYEVAMAYMEKRREQLRVVPNRFVDAEGVLVKWIVCHHRTESP